MTRHAYMCVKLVDSAAHRPKSLEVERQGALPRWADDRGECSSFAASPHMLTSGQLQGRYARSTYHSEARVVAVAAEGTARCG